MHLGFRHQSLRRRGLLATPRSKALLRLADVLAYMASVFGLLFTLDQVWLIWIEQNAAGVSLLAWSAYTTTASVWVFYGIVHRDRVLVTVNVVWVFLNAFIVGGIVLYR